jgi:hypothetical protein
VAAAVATVKDTELENGLLENDVLGDELALDSSAEQEDDRDDDDDRDRDDEFDDPDDADDADDDLDRDAA